MWVRLLGCAKIGEKRLRRRFEEEFGTTLPRFDVLAALYRQPDGMNMGMLSRALLVSNGNVTALVRQLQQQGLVRATPDPQDARISMVALTGEGQRQFLIWAEAHHRWVGEMLGGLGEEEVVALAQGLGILRRLLAGEESVAS